MFLKQTAYKPRSNSQSSTTSAPSPPESPEAESKPRTSSQTWEDRRFMWQKGNESSSGRKSSFSGVAEAVQKASPFTISKPNTNENPHPTAFRKDSMSEAGATMPTPALRDRHAIHAKGREVHETVGARRKSSASTTGQSGMLANLLGYGGAGK